MKMKMNKAEKLVDGLIGEVGFEPGPHNPAGPSKSRRQTGLSKRRMNDEPSDTGLDAEMREFAEDVAETIRVDLDDFLDDFGLEPGSKEYAAAEASVISRIKVALNSKDGVVRIDLNR